MIRFASPCGMIPSVQLMSHSFHSKGGSSTPRPNIQHRIEEEHAIRRIQQAQLDSLQVQLRDYGQQQSETSDQIAELANAIAELYQQVNLLRQTVNQTMNDVLRHFDSPPVINLTQSTATQPEFHPS